MKVFLAFERLITDFDKICSLSIDFALSFQALKYIFIILIVLLIF